jgi:hypothetical protein
MAADVWIDVEDYEIVRGAMENEILFVVSWILVGFAEDAALGIRHFRSGGRDVFVPPGAPEPFHEG